MNRMLPLAVLALACIASCSPATAMGLLPAHGQDPSAVSASLAHIGTLICFAVLAMQFVGILSRRIVVGAIIAACAFFSLPSLGVAADAVAKFGDASVTLSAEAMVAAVAPTVSAFAVTALSTLATILLGRVGPVWLSALLQSRIETMIYTAVQYALNAVEGAARGQTLSIPVGSAVIAKALQRALDSSPRWVIRAAGGPEEIGARIFRSLDLEPDSTAAKVLEPALQGLGKAAR